MCLTQLSLYQSPPQIQDEPKCTPQLVIPAVASNNILPFIFGSFGFKTGNFLEEPSVTSSLQHKRRRCNKAGFRFHDPLGPINDLAQLEAYQPPNMLCLERLRFSLLGSSKLFQDTWNPFLELAKSLLLSSDQ